uniref:Uncharacterized protein n=1 Tax=Panagrolaimus superbus TaxID=310955 RepID=A0A914Y322_9BILA
MSEDTNDPEKTICEVSQWKMPLEKRTQIFQYVVAAIGNGKSKNLCTTGQYVDKKRCKEAIEKIFPKRYYIYNNQEILYLHEQLDIDIKETIPSLNGDLESLNGDLEISITFRAKIDISNINEIRAFLNTALNQFSINENKYSFVGKGQIYEVQDDETDEARKYKKYGLVIRHGNSKGVQFINNDSGAILAMDYKKSVFYSGNASFLDVIKNCLSINLSYAEISELYKNVQLQVIHQPGEYFRFENFTNDIKDLQVKSMGEYFQNQYDQIIEMEYKAVMVHPKCVYLLETLEIVPDQKISKEKLSTLKLDTKNLSIKKRLEGIKNQYANMQFNNVITEAFGINVSTEMIKAEYVQLSVPCIIAGDNKSINPNEDGTFRFDRDHSYCEIASIKNLFVYGCPEKWKQILQKQLKERKITVENIYCNNNPKDISTFEQWKNKLAKIDPSVDYVIVITKTQDIHDLLNLLQIKTGIRIQHILEATTQINACIFNIIHKMNHKAKGFNWKVGFKG